ncbi:MAG: 5'-nucleotidase [Ilumatobacter sp.]
MSWPRRSQVSIVAPAENQSARSDSVTDPGPNEAESATTASGLSGFAVSGTPADAVNFALDFVFAADPPALVVSGSNKRQNGGPVTVASRTVGAARTAARRGVPAIAISQSLGDEPDLESGLPILLEWITEHRDVIVEFDGEFAEVANLNISTCGDTGVVRGLIDTLPMTDDIPEGLNMFAIDCSSTEEDPTNAVAALAIGFATLVRIPAQMVREASSADSVIDVPAQEG